jgi:WD40 repeat protein
MKSMTWSITLFLLVLNLLSFAVADEPVLLIDPQGHSAIISDVMFTPGGDTLVSVSLDKTIRVWDVENGDLHRTLRIPIGDGVEGMIHAGALSPDGTILAVAGWPWNSDFGIPVYLFDLERGEIIALLKGHEDVILGLDFSQDGKWLVSGGDTTARLWDVSGFVKTPRQDVSAVEPVLVLESGEEGVTGVAISSDGRIVASADFGGTFRIWKLADDHRAVKKSWEITKHEGSIEDLAYSPSDEYIATVGGDYNILLWNAKGKVVKRIESETYPQTVAFSADSKKMLVAGTEDAPAVVYAVPSGKELASFGEHTNVVLASAFYKNDLVATAGGNDKDIYIWDAGTGKIRTHIVGDGQAVWSVAFGEGMEVAFGRTNTAIGKVNPGAEDFTQFADYPKDLPLEYSFDFADMSLNRNTPDATAFTRSLTTHQNQKLQRVTWDELQVTGGGTIRNDRFGARWIRAYTFTPQGNVVTGFEPWIRVYQNDGALIHELSGHTGTIWALAASKDGRFLASASDDQTLKLWNLETGEALATLFVTRDFEWICWTPQGYYAASAGGERYIGWHLNQGEDKAAKFYPVSVFRKRFHNPELVKQTVALGSFEQALTVVNAEARQPIAPQQVTEVLPPTIQWVSPADFNITTADSSVRIQANIALDEEITEVKILVNGKAQVSHRGLLTIDDDAAPETPIDEMITLVPGKNEITIFVANRNAGATSELRTVVYDSEQDWMKPDVYMLSVGISQYEGQGLNLEFADDDAKAISAVFRAQEGLLYKSVTIRELYDTDATQDSILEALDWLEDETTQKDVAVIFMAAHGVNDDRGNFYLLPSDGDPEKLRRTAVDWNDFVEVLGNLPSRVLFFLDTCHSGQLGANLVRMRGAVDNTEAIRELTSEENGVVLLAASTGREYSLEHVDWGHGAFTKALLDGLQSGNADYSQDGIIHLRELDTYISERVKELTSGSQHPTTLKPSTISRFPIVQVAQ